MPTVTVHYENDLQCRAVHEATGDEIRTDAPKDNQGLGRHFSPTDTVAAAMASCMATIMGIYARRHDLDLNGMRVEVEKIMSSEGPRRIDGLPVIIHVPIAVEERHQQALRLAAEGCPVHRSLGDHMDKSITILFPEA